MAIERTATAVWKGSVAKGSGTINGGTGALKDLTYDQPTRVGEAKGHTSPEELVAAAHAGCLAMSLANQLTRRNAPPDELSVESKIVMDEVEGGRHLIVRAEVTIRAQADTDE